ncbi:stimulator of interferon genes protein [Tiliqua scincoides]|uniref:stimulator of interferon genes protein n=1 Tax=Tiliqua scincoides TaxID=71010 RepID=UPI003461AC6D
MSHNEEGSNVATHCVIPKPRGNQAQHMQYIILALFVIFLYFYQPSPYHTAQGVIIHFTALQIGALIKGICNLAEEMLHVTSRYHGSYLKAFSACLGLHQHGLTLLLCGAAYVLLFKTEFPKETDLRLNLIIVCFCQLLSINFGLQRPSLAEISEICEKNNLYVAHGLAWSYYIGYLKVILPRLKDLINDFNKSNNYLLNSKKTWKLHILIPLSCEVYDDLQKVDNRIQFIDNLPEVKMDRAGIKKRSYKNSVYGVMDEEQKMNYCVMEYATPLQSLYAMSQDESAAFSRLDRLEQAKLFCRTLEEILQRSKDCSGCYQLIVYEDSGESNKHFLSKAILQCIRQENEEEYTISERDRGFVPSQNFPCETQLLISDSDEPQPLMSLGH